MTLKAFSRRYEIPIIVIVTLLVIYFIIVFSQKINFILGNELVVLLTPHQKSFYMRYGDTINSDFNISIDNVAYCSATCYYEFNDRSRSETIDNGYFTIKKNQHVSKTYNLSIKRVGVGQDLYSFDLKCHSIRSSFCLTKSINKSRSSLIIVNYDLTETEKKLKQICALS